MEMEHVINTKMHTLRYRATKDGNVIFSVERNRFDSDGIALPATSVAHGRLCPDGRIQWNGGAFADAVELHDFFDCLNVLFTEGGLLFEKSAATDPVFNEITKRFTLPVGGEASAIAPAPIPLYSPVHDAITFHVPGPLSGDSTLTPSVEVLKLTGNGDIFVHGKLVENDKGVVAGLREFLKLNSILIK